MASGRVSTHPISYHREAGRPHAPRPDDECGCEQHAFVDRYYLREQRSYVGLSPRRCEAKIPLADTSRMSTEGPSLIRPRRSPDTSTGRHRRAWRRSLRGGELGVFTVATVRDDAASDAPRVSSTHINRCLRAVCGPAEVGQHQARSPTGIAANVHSVPRESATLVSDVAESSSADRCAHSPDSTPRTCSHM